MKFVSEVVSKEGHVHGLGRLNTSINKFLYAIVHDTENDEDTRIDDIAALSVFTYGYCKERGVIVAHTPKTVQLHEHIGVAETVDCKPSFDFSGMDSVQLMSGIAVLGMSDTIVVDTSDKYIYITGVTHSVVLWQDTSGGPYRYMTLYDALGRLCKLTGINLLTYKKIFLCSKKRYYFTQIELIHNQDVDRFFTKMYFDVS